MNGYFNYRDELYHYGILGMKWGVRRYQDYGKGGYNPKKAQKKEFKLAKKTQTSGYKSDYDRMLDYQKESKVVQERSKELTDLAEKARDLDFDLQDYKETKAFQKANSQAVKKAREYAKKTIPEYTDDPFNNKFDDRIIESLLYDDDFLEKEYNLILKNDKDYKNLKSQRNKAIKEYKEKCHEITNEIIGDYGDKKISGLGTDMSYRELVYYALSKPHTMWMFTWEEDMGRK